MTAPPGWHGPRLPGHALDRWHGLPQPARGFIHLIITLLLTTLATRAVAADNLTLIADGRSDYQIVVLQPAYPTTHLAADELQTYLHKATGVQLPVTTTPDMDKAHILIARSDNIAPHGFRIQTTGRNIWLRGRDSDGSPTGVDAVNPIHRGTCNAVYALLERFVGVRWYWSDELGEIIPKTNSVSIPADLDINEEPHFDYRMLPYGPPGASKGDWARRNRLGAAISMHHGHNLHRVVPVFEWAQRGHPEYAAMINNKHVPGGPSGNSTHVCTSNPEVIRIVAQEASKAFARHPQQQMFSISLPDGSGMCTCPKCRGLDVSGYRIPRGPRAGNPVKTDRVIEFYNAVAEIVSRDHPDRFLGGYIYADYLYPARRIERVHPNVVLVVAPNTAMEMAQAETRAFVDSLFSFWGDFHDRVYAYDTLYLIRRAFGLPAPMGDDLTELVRLYAENDINGAYLYIGPTWEALGPDAWLASRLLWNPQGDVEKWRNDYYHDLYGPAAEHVKDYFETARQCAERRATADGEKVERLTRYFPHVKFYGREYIARLILGYEPALAELAAHVTAAESAARGNPKVEKRVTRLRDNLTLTQATIAGLRAVVDYESDGGHDPKKLIPLARAIKTREALLDRIDAGWGAALEEAIRFGDNNIRSPLRPDGEYKSALKADVGN